MQLPSNLHIRIPQRPPGGKPQGNAGGLVGAGEAMSNPAPPGGLQCLCPNPRPGAPPHQEGGPRSEHGPQVRPGGGSGVWGQRPQHYLDCIAKDATDSATTSVLTLHTQYRHQLSFEDSCPGWATIGTCPNGHRYAKELVCGREYCPTCGQKHSIAHNRRIARWLPKARQVARMGYLVITIPPEYRWQLENKPHIRWAYDRIVEVLAGKRRGRLPRANGHFSRGLARWHWFGDKPGKWHPHLNVLVEGGYLGRSKLRQLRRRLASSLHMKDLVINYQFTRDEARKAFWLSYVNRATFTDKSWAPDFADITLYNFRNARYWGKWDGDPVWGQPEAVDETFSSIANLEEANCPHCGEHIDWQKPMRTAYISPLFRLEPLGAGYYEVKDRSPPI